MTSKHSSASRLLSTGIFDSLNSFADIEARVSALPSNKERGDAFEIFAEAYLATQKIAQAQEVWPFEAVPLEQRQALSLDTGRDMGVDGTYLTIDGELRAYQVKFRSNRTSLTWDELSTFMGLTDQVKQRVLFINSESLPSLMQDRSGFVAIRGSDLDRLTAADFEVMRQWLHSGQVEQIRKQPLPHQQEALTAIAQSLEVNDRATVVMACGTGKSLVSLWAAEQQNSKNILVLVPSLALVRQLLHEWLRETAWERFTFMCVCSDPTVTKGADALVVHQADLDFPVTTESAVVSQFLGKAFDGIKIVFSTYQSAQVVAAGLPVGADGMAQPFDLAIFDEAHKTASREGTRFSFALEDANLPIRKRLFFTATPRHYDIRKKNKEGDNTLVYSMDKPEVYGPVIHTLSFAEAARRGIICDYKVVISVVTSEMVNDELLKNGEVMVAGDTVKARQVALQIALQKAVEKYGVSRIFTFHGSVAAARSFTSTDGEGIRHHLPDFTTLHVSGEMPTSRREDNMKVFRQADKAVMSNARCLTEGVDVPAVDMVAFISPRKSKVDIVQATGRAMRKSPGKEFGYVMVPLFVEQAADETIEEALHRTGFDDIWDLLGAMREQDEVLTDIIRQMREDKGRTGGYDEGRFSERVEVLGPNISLDTIRESIAAECLDYLGDSWDERFGELLAYKEEYGNFKVPQKWPTRLGSWISVQRSTKDSMSPERKARLETLPGWSWDVLSDRWDEGFCYLKEYADREGHAKIPQDCKAADGYRVGSWASEQRKNKDSMSTGRKARLEALPGWVWGLLLDKWEEGFHYLKEYTDREGHTKISTDYKTADGYRLAQWISVQRKVKDSMSPERKARLEALLGWSWDVLSDRWDERFHYLKEYADREGHTKISTDYKTADGCRLGTWVSNQRKNKDSMSPDRKARLEALPGWSWDVLSDNWDEYLGELLAYKAEHGDTDVPLRYDTNLGVWVVNQRMVRKKGILSPERIKRLDDAGFIWDTLESKWEVKFSELLLYKAKHGDMYVPQNYPTGLGQWITKQKRLLNRGELNPDRKRRLDEVGFVWDSHDAKWEEGFSKLLSYKAEHGNVNVPANWPTGLGAWVSTQRGRRRQGIISADQVQRLEEIDFDWEPLNSDWNAMFNELFEYKSTYGHVNIPQRPPTSLGRWVRGQRNSMKIGRLSPEQISRLEAIGFEWDMLDSKWKLMFNELLDFKTEHGHMNVPIDWATYLGTWVSLQRKANKKASNRGGLTLDRKKRLDEIGFIWDALDYQWEERFNELVAYKTVHGDVDVPSKWPSGLGVWIGSQRVSDKKGTLSHERKARLEEVGIAWDSFEAKWEAGFSELLQYKAEQGDTNVPRSWSTRLGLWVAVQRAFHKEGKLLPERKKRLDEIGFEWNVHDSKWDVFYKELLEYKVQHGNTKVPISWPTKLGQWVRHQRVAKKNGEILPDRENRLNEIGFLWGANEKRNAK